MEITSLLFLTFVGVTFLIYYIIPKKYQWVVLLASSVLFFVASSALLTFYMLFTTVVIYLGARWIQKYKDLFYKKKKELPKPERKVLKEQLKKKQKEMDADHVLAWSHGGATDESNCQMLCKTHNRAKGNR